jgi:hypothetical protein
MNISDEQIKLAFARLMEDYGFVLNIGSEGALKEIILENEHIEITIVEEHRPHGIYNVTFYDGNDLWLGLPTFYKFKGLPFDYKWGCIKPEDFQDVANFLADNYAEVFRGDEASKQALLNFYHKKS